MQPWEIHQALTAERLEIVGTIIRDVRIAVALRMERDKGDTLWGAGCSTYERTKFALANAAIKKYSEWLSVSEADHHFLIKIGLVPIRFYRGTADEDVPAKYAVGHQAEQDALEFAFKSSDTPTPDFLLRLEVETDTDSHPVRVTLWQVDPHGGKHNEYAIPERTSQSVRSIARKKPPVTVPSPTVGSRKQAAAPPERTVEFGDNSP